MRTIFITIALIVYLFPLNAFSADKKLNSDKTLERKWDKDSSLIRLITQDDSIIYGVKGTLKESGNSDGLFTSWTKTLLKATKRNEMKSDLKKAVSQMVKWEFDCNSRKLLISKILYYNNKGNVIYSSDIPDDWQEPIPQSTGEYMLNLACNYAVEKDTELKAQEIPIGSGIKGVVLETMNSGGYTYIYVVNEHNESKWLALPEIVVSVNDKIEYPETPPLINFTSKTLNKHFDEVSFIPGIRVFK